MNSRIIHQILNLENIKLNEYVILRGEENSYIGQFYTKRPNNFDTSTDLKLVFKLFAISFSNRPSLGFVLVRKLKNYRTPYIDLGNKSIIEINNWKKFKDKFKIKDIGKLKFIFDLNEVSNASIRYTIINLMHNFENNFLEFFLKSKPDYLLRKQVKDSSNNIYDQGMEVKSLRKLVSCIDLYCHTHNIELNESWRKFIGDRA